MELFHGGYHIFGVHVSGWADRKLLALVDLNETTQETLVGGKDLAIDTLGPEGWTELFLVLEIVY